MMVSSIFSYMLQKFQILKQWFNTDKIQQVQTIFPELEIKVASIFPDLM